MRGINAYRRAKQEIADSFNRVSRAVFEQSFDEDGNQLPFIAYGAGLHLRSPLTAAEQERFLQEYHQNVAERWPEDEQIFSGPDLMGSAVSRTPGQLSDIVNCSMIGPLSPVNYDTTGMSEKEIADLRHRQSSTYIYANASMSVTLQPVEGRNGIHLEQEPEILRMDDNPTHKVVIQPTGYTGFVQQGDIAAQLLSCITETSVMRDKLPPDNNMRLQLPSGQ